MNTHAKKSRDAFWILIAMWLWCSAAAGETLPVTTQTLEQNNYQAILTPPCNWDKDVGKVTATAVYADPGEYTEVRDFSILDRESVVNVPITPTSTTVMGDKLYMSFDPTLPKMHDGKYLYHVNVNIETTKTQCKEGFGFGFGTRPR